MARSYHMRRVELYKKLTDNTWDSEAIVLTDATKLEVKLGAGRIKDTFKFRISNANDKLTRQLYNGDGSTTAFTIPTFFVPPASYLGTDQFKVYVDNVLQTNVTDYGLSGTTLTFGTAPPTGNENVEVRFEVVSADDKVAIYLWQDAIWGDMNDAAKELAFQIEGTITQPSLTSNDAGRVLSINGNGIIESLFGSLAFVKPTSLKKWHVLIQEMISQINQFAPAGKKIYGQDATEWSNLGNPALNSSGGAFPDIQFSASYKRGIEILEELAQDKYTKDGDYTYYVKRVDIGGNLVYGLFVRYKDPDVTSGNEIIQGVTQLSSKAKRATDDVINAIIYNCGYDPYERGMEYLNYNPASQSSLGSKWKYVTTTAHLGQTVVNIEFEDDISKWETTAGDKRKENFPKDASYPYTFTFEGRDDTDGSLTGSSATAADDDEFADAIRLECKWRGKEETNRIIQLYSNPRYKTTFLKYQSNGETLGGAYEITLPSFALYTHPVRLLEIKSTFWETELSFEEDETVAAR